MNCNIIKYTKAYKEDKIYPGCTPELLDALIQNIFDSAINEKTLVAVNIDNEGFQYFSNINPKNHKVENGSIYHHVPDSGSPECKEVTERILAEVFYEPKPFDIDRVIYKNPKTIVIWKDGTQTAVQAVEGDAFDEEKGLAMAIAKKALGNTKDYWKVFEDYCDNHEPEENM